MAQSVGLSNQPGHDFLKCPKGHDFMKDYTEQNAQGEQN
jgi:hypothetical protein